MRIVAEVPHPVYRISILQHMGKYTIKIEADATEQAYKIRESEKISSTDDVVKLVTTQFLKKVDKVFLDLGDNLLHLLHASEDPNSEFELVEGII